MFYASSLDNSVFKGRKSFFFSKKEIQRSKKCIPLFLCPKVFFLNPPPTILLILFVVNLINFFFP